MLFIKKKKKKKMQCPGCGIDVPSSEEIVGAQVSLI